MYLQIKPGTKPCDILCDALVGPPCRMTKTHFVEGAENRSQDNLREIAIAHLIRVERPLFPLGCAMACLSLAVDRQSIPGLSTRY